ncbi:MAG: pantoate--beta-alanine ligase [Bacteroidota bacterium]
MSKEFKKTVGEGKTFNRKISISGHFITNSMILFKKTSQLQAYLQNERSHGNNIGFVPTMGALHKGHLSLITASKQDNGITVASIFVNPAQFNDKKDFDKYPAAIEKDIELLVAAGCDVLFWPAVEEIYPEGYDQPVHYELGYLEVLLEGKYRPGHFQGVCRVMNRLLHIVQPDNLYMGQKDYQQCMVVNRLLAIIQSPARLHACPTLRETDGLAMSSRNMRLNDDERKKAVTISVTLKYLKENIQQGNVNAVIEKSKSLLAEKNFRVDYVAVSNARTLEPVTSWDGKQKIVALIAAFQNEVRLIDNMLLN